MGFVSHVLENVTGIQWYYTVGLFIFVILFIVMVYKTIKIPKADLMKYKQAVLDSEEQMRDK